MKKLMIMAAFAAFGLSTATAQEVSFGAKAGVNIANVSSDDIDNTSSLTSFHIGAVANIALSEEFLLQPELFYSEEGYTYKIDGSADVKLNYLNLPILAKYMIVDGLSIEAGPQIGFLLSGKIKYDGISADIKDQLKSTSFSAAMGLGYKLDSGINFAARYNLGLSNIVDFEGSEGAKAKSNVFLLSVGYMF